MKVNSKPKVKRAYVTVRDPDTRKSEHLTVYGSDVADVVRKLGGLPTGKTKRPTAA